MKNRQYSFKEWIELEKFFEGKNTIMDTVKKFEEYLLLEIEDDIKEQLAAHG